jgi:hypothetical protein
MIITEVGPATLLEQHGIDTLRDPPEVGDGSAQPLLGGAQFGCAATRPGADQSKRQE